MVGHKKGRQCRPVNKKILHLRAITALIVLANKKTVAKVVIFSELTKFSWFFLVKIIYLHTDMKQIEVVAAIICKDDKIFATQRGYGCGGKNMK